MLALVLNFDTETRHGNETDFAASEKHSFPGLEKVDICSDPISITV